MVQNALMVWKPEQAILLSRFKSSTYSSKAILLLTPPCKFMNLFAVSRTLCSSERMPSVKAIKWMEPIAYLVLLVKL